MKVKIELETKDALLLHGFIQASLEKVKSIDVETASAFERINDEIYKHVKQYKNDQI